MSWVVEIELLDSVHDLIHQFLQSELLADEVDRWDELQRSFGDGDDSPVYDVDKKCEGFWEVVFEIQVAFLVSCEFCV